jgi:hypothetical protein
MRALTVEEQWLVAMASTALGLTATGLFVWWLGRRLARLDARVAQLTAALALLTDTAEAGFESLTRMVSPPAAAASAAAPARARGTTRQRRVRSAANRGRSVNEIAAAEHVSEGEVRLMLQVAGGVANGHVAERRHAEVR